MWENVRPRVVQFARPAIRLTNTPFFYDIDEMPWGFDPLHKGKWEVLYFAEISTEAPSPPTLAKASVLTRTYLRPSKVDVLPNANSESIRKLELSDEEWDAYCDFSIGEDVDAGEVVVLDPISGAVLARFTSAEMP